MNYSELKEIFQELKRNSPKEDLTAHIIFTEGSFDEKYSLLSRTYSFSSDNKAFLPNMGGYSIFASCLDGHGSMGPPGVVYGRQEKAELDDHYDCEDQGDNYGEMYQDGYAAACFSRIEIPTTTLCCEGSDGDVCRKDRADQVRRDHIHRGTQSALMAYLWCINCVIHQNRSVQSAGAVVSLEVLDEVDNRLMGIAICVRICCINSGIGGWLAQSKVIGGKISVACAERFRIYKHFIVLRLGTESLPPIILRRVSQPQKFGLWR